MTAVLLMGCGDNEYLQAEKEYRQDGIAYMTSGDYDKAAEAFQKALDQAKNGIGDLEIDICLYKAEALYQDGDLDGAVEVYSALIDYCGYPDAYYLRGNIYFSQGENEAGKSDLEQAIAGDPDNSELCICVYETMERYGMAEEAEPYLQTVVEQKGEKAADKLLKGRAYELLGETDKAIEYLQAAIDKGEAEANFYMAQLYTADGQAEEAEKYFQAYLESGKVTAESLQSLGENCMNTGDYEAALSYLNAALELEPGEGYQQLLKDAVIANEYTGDFATAYSLLQQYTEKYPDDDEATAELDFLSTR